jgi:UDP-N-acetylglucosamine--N-acetylmuramyl-(pentapeptide) pyrophosphoryl-undecaprenol N-acetylglucosamine transferase
LNQQSKYKFIISGGGTGGHIFPAISIANELKTRYPECDIQFVGAKDRMEMQKVPQAGYPITGIWISGIQRSQMWKNINFPFKLISSIWSCYRLVNKVKPDAVIGTGGFASGPLMYVAQNKGIPTFIQEQNSFPGITNKLLAKKAEKICVAYDGLERFFPKPSIVKTGNPVREAIAKINSEISENEKSLNLLVLGGSLGARSVNNEIKAIHQSLLENNINITWQCGALYFENLKTEVAQHNNLELTDFISDMPAAYNKADIIISRAGAGTISELCIVGKPVILIPSPNVAEDHQTKNANAISDNHAAIALPEKEIGKLETLLLDLFKDTTKRQELSKNIKSLAKPNATKEIVNEIINGLG